MQEPPKTTSTAKKLRFLVIGAGARGTAYAQAVTKATSAVIHAVADPHVYKREQFGRAFIWGDDGRPGEGQVFGDWREWADWEVQRRERIISNKASDEGKELGDGGRIPDGVDGIFICTLDSTHAEIIHAVARLHVHILCEKPLALSLSDCLSVYHVLQHQPEEKKRIFSIGHVLRYSPHNILLRDLVLSKRVIGDIISMEHCEPVGWWHFAHSYVRGNWRRYSKGKDGNGNDGAGSLLTKSCHDIDFILWLLCSPPDRRSRDGDQTPHHPKTITSTGSLTQFKPTKKPLPVLQEQKQTKTTITNCLSCPSQHDCIYSAPKIYRDMHLSQHKTGWPVNIVCPDVEDTFHKSGPEAAEKLLLSALKEDYDKSVMADEDIAKRPWYGRCIYEADNDVCDDQVVTISWAEEEDPGEEGSGSRKTAKIATFHMIAPTEKQCERRGRIYGTNGELSYDSHTITIYSFETRETTVIDVPRQPPEEEESHGGGDYGLARSFVNAVDAVENQGWEVDEAQTHFVGCTLEEAVRSHAVVFAAEEARREEKVVKWKEWWDEKLRVSAAAAAAAPVASA